MGAAVTDLLELAVRAHGGLARWERISRFNALVSITGAIWDLKARSGLLSCVALEGTTRDQSLTISPFPVPGRYVTWEPYRQAVMTSDGALVTERLNPVASFDGLTRESPWDELQVAYFASEANWNYFTAPFVFTRPGFLAEEIDPCEEEGQSWRSLRVTYPDDIVTHTRRQTYHFDESGLLRRLDYSVDILGGGDAVHYPSDYRDFDGILVPTRRRVYARDGSGRILRDQVAVAIDITDITFG
ncbi:hypothetical protein [Streptomyces sp. NPDC048411]|uniref:hypothetical protein n=1 Tax=Streptomyces sp. NPDC048411 TaxID=3157206 RepID=UPI0034511268